MKTNYTTRLSILLFFIFSLNSFAQKDRSFWIQTSKENTSKKELKLRKTNPEKAQYFNLNIDALKNHLTDAPQRNSTENTSEKLVDFPTANDSFETFSVMEASVLEKPLQDKYPNIKTYVGKSISNPSNTIRFKHVLQIHQQDLRNLQRGMKCPSDPHHKNIGNIKRLQLPINWQACTI